MSANVLTWIAIKKLCPMVYTHQNVNMGACCIQDALDILKDGNKQQFLDNIEKWGCVLGKGMNNQMFDLIKHSSIYCKMDCKVLMDGYEVLRGWMLEHTKLDVDNFTTIQSLASKFMLLPGCYDIMCIKSVEYYSSLSQDVLPVAGS